MRKSSAQRLCPTAILRAVTSDDLLVGLDEILAARERIAGHVHRTPMLSSSTAARFIAAAGGPRLADDRLYLKAENLQKTGSFKARGMTNRIATLEPGAAGPRRDHDVGRATRARRSPGRRPRPASRWSP